MVVPEKVYLYHVTAIANLPSIIERGGLVCKNRLLEESRNYEDIAYSHIQDRRATREVTCAQGGCLHDYVPFYFGPRPPMLLPIQSGDVDGYDDGQRPIVHLVTRFNRVEKANLPFVFTDRHAVLALAQFYERRADLSKVDFGLMKKRYWYDTDEYPDRKERRQAEFLIHDAAPLGLFGAIGVMDEAMQKETRRVLQPIDDAPPVIVKRGWYY